MYNNWRFSPAHSAWVPFIIQDPVKFRRSHLWWRSGCTLPHEKIMTLRCYDAWGTMWIWGVNVKVQQATRLEHPLVGNHCPPPLRNSTSKLHLNLRSFTLQKRKKEEACFIWIPRNSIGIRTNGTLYYFELQSNKMCHKYNIQVVHHCRLTGQIYWLKSIRWSEW